MDICTASVNPTGCGHYTLTVSVDGVPVVVPVHDGELQVPLSVEETEMFVRLSARRLRQKGVTLAAFLNLITHGDEATNVKFYPFSPPGVNVTKTNIGTAYVNLFTTGANGLAVPVDFTGCTLMRLVVYFNPVTVASGQTGIRLVRDSDSAVLYENTNINGGTSGEQRFDTDWIALPPAAIGSLAYVRAQVKSTVAADDPVFRFVEVGAR